MYLQNHPSLSKRIESRHGDGQKTKIWPELGGGEMDYRRATQDKGIFRAWRISLIQNDNEKARLEKSIYIVSSRVLRAVKQDFKTRGKDLVKTEQDQHWKSSGSKLWILASCEMYFYESTEKIS